MKKKVLFTSLACMSLLFSGLVACNSTSSSSKQESKSESQPASSVQSSSEVQPASSLEPASSADTSAPEQGSSSSSSAVAHVHVWDLPNKAELEEEYAEIDTPATCEQAGQKTWYCECGDTKTEAIKKLGHDWGQWVNVPDHGPTCTQGTEQKRECSRCDAFETKFLDDALGHEWGETPVATEKNADGKDVTLKECSRNDAKCIAIAFEDWSTRSADFGDTSGYSNVPEELRNSYHLLAKSSTMSWKFNVDKAITGAKISFDVVCTNSDQATTEFADNRYQTKVNDGEFITWRSAPNNTYGDAGIKVGEIKTVVALTADLVAGENTIELKQGNGGYRLLFGGEVKIEYAGDAAPVTPFMGYNITFVPGEHCKVYVYEGKDYTVDPVETNTCIAKDEDGNIVPYDVEDELPQPQVNFKVVCDEGWKVAKANIAVDGTFKNLKAGPDENEGLPDAEHFRITKVRTDLTVTITPVEDAGGEQNPGYVVDFVTSHCSVVVYVGDKDETGSNVDAGPAYYTRNKDNPANYSLNNGQTWFEVVPEAGYKFVSGIEVGGEDGDGVPFVSGNYNKVKQTAANVYNITKINSDIAVSLKCIPEGGEEGLGYEITFVAEHCQILVYEDGQDYRFTPTAPVDGKTLSRNDKGDAAKYAAKVDGVDANGDGDYDDEGDTAPVAEVKPQVNFKVVPEEGYEFVSGIDVNAEASGVSFVSGNYNKVKNMDNGIYRVTKIKDNLTITITATLIANA